MGNVTQLKLLCNELLSKGYRTSPNNGNNPMPYGDGQSYTSDHPAYDNAVYISVPVPEDCLLLDRDGYKPGAASVADISSALGVTIDELNEARVQDNGSDESVHWLFRLPAGYHINASTGKWLPHVDCKTNSTNPNGTRNGLINVKLEKMRNFPNVADIKPLDVSKIVIPFPVKAIAPVTLSAVPHAVAEVTSIQGLRALKKACKEMRETEINRNEKLNQLACRIGNYVAGGDITELDARTDLTVAALACGLDASEVAKTLESGLGAGMKRPEHAPKTPKEVFDQAPKVEPLPVPEIQPFETLTVVRGTCPFKNQVRASDELRTAVFKGRLRNFNGTAYWWNGQCWEVADEGLLHRHVGNSMFLAEDNSLTDGRIKATTNVMISHLESGGELNPVSRKIFFPNGVLDMNDESRMYPHHPDNMNSSVLACNYNPDARCDEWLEWMDDIFAEEDPERIQLLQEMMGYSLITDNLGIQKAILFIGVTRAGKGVILDLIKKILTDNSAGSFTLPTLDDDKVLASMRSKNVSIDFETASPSNQSSRQIITLFKAITANEPVGIKLLYKQDTVQKPLNCKLFMAANTVPAVFDDSSATAKRFMALVFTKSADGREDVTIPARMAKEMEGITLWAVEGLRRLIKNGRFNAPESSKEQMKYMVQSGSPVANFITDCCKFDREYRIPDSKLYTTYMGWCLANTIEPMKRKHFLNSFKDAALAKGAQWKESIPIGDKKYRGFYGVDVL